MEQFKVFEHPTNSLRTAIFHLKKSMKMLAVREDLEDMSDLKPARNFFKATFAKDERFVVVHFCVLPMLRGEALFWDDKHIIDCVIAFNENKQIGTLQSLLQTQHERMMFEMQRQALDKVA